MSIGRTSASTSSSIRILTAALLIGFLPGVSASCWIDSSGVEYCDGLSPAARAGIGLAFFFLFLAVLFGLLGYRRRRANRANLVYVQQPRPGGAGAFGSPYGGPQYPPQAHYDPNTGFAPPGGSPPQYYPPPPGAPPFSPQSKV